MREEVEALNETPNDYSAQDEYEHAWDIEIQKRLADVESGRAKLIPADVMFNNVRKHLDSYHK